MYSIGDKVINDNKKEENELLKTEYTGQLTRYTHSSHDLQLYKD